MIQDKKGILKEILQFSIRKKPEVLCPGLSVPSADIPFCRQPPKEGWMEELTSRLPSPLVTMQLVPCMVSSGDTKHHVVLNP